MLHRKQYPGWLVRRNYFRRVGRWVKPRRRPEVERDATPSFDNVLPFPEPAKAPRRGAEMTARDASPA